MKRRHGESLLPDSGEGCGEVPGQSLRLPVERGGDRLDSFLRDALDHSPLLPEGAALSREKIKRLIREGAVAVDGKLCLTPKAALKTGSLVTVTLPAVETRLAPEEGELSVLYEDASLVVLDKPAGLTVHPCPSCPQGTLAHRLVAHFPSLRQQEGFRPGIVHRLDKDTSGLLVAALTEEARLALSSLFAGRELVKEYLALVHGVPHPLEGRIEAPLGRHPTSRVKMAVVPGGREAVSLYRVLHADEYGRFSLLAVRILTGRTHQIRVHMAHIGHPLLGDALYRRQEKTETGDRAATRKARAGRASRAAGAATGPGSPMQEGLLPPLAQPARQMLHAWRLAFAHPFPLLAGKDSTGLGSGERVFICPPPADFAETIARCVERPFRVVLTGMPGSGKSTLLAALAALGLPTFSCDTAVRNLYLKNGEGHAFLLARYGKRFVREGAKAGEGAVDTAALGRAMQESPGLRHEVEQFVHPLVFAALRAFWREQVRAPLCVAEVPLFFETTDTPHGLSEYGIAECTDVVVNVHCPFAVRAKRLAQWRGWDAATIAMMESWQRPEEEKNRRSHLVVENTGGAEELAAKGAGLHETLLAMRKDCFRRAAAAFLRFLSERCWAILP